MKSQSEWNTVIAPLSIETLIKYLTRDKRIRLLPLDWQDSGIPSVRPAMDCEYGSSRNPNTTINHGDLEATGHISGDHWKAKRAQGQFRWFL